VFRGGILMQEVVNATDVRKEWGKFIDDVVRSRPAVVKRNRDYFAALSLEHLEVLLAPYNLSMEYDQEEDGSYSGWLKEIDIAENACTLETLKNAIAIELIEYANEYMKEFNKYYSAPNRRSHFPYVLRVLTKKNALEVENLIDA
jgi:hypothetical protein